MAKTSVADWDTTAANNLDLNNISLAENIMRPPAVNNAFREMMAQIKAGVPYLSGTSFLIESTDAGATAGPTLDLYRNSATPAASDIIGKVIWNGEDSAGNAQEYASIETVIVDPVSTTEDGRLDFYVTKAGVRTKFASMTATVTAFTGAAGYTFDAAVRPSSNDGAALGVASTGGWSDLFFAAGAVINYDNGDVMLTHSSDRLTLSGGVFRAPGFSTDDVSINDDAVGSFGDLSPNGFGTLMVWATSGASAMDAFMVRIRTSAAPSISLITTFGLQTNLAVTTSNVTGTTGTDGKITISATNGSLKIENRSGSTLGVGLLMFRA